MISTAALIAHSLLIVRAVARPAVFAFWAIRLFAETQFWTFYVEALEKVLQHHRAKGALARQDAMRPRARRYHLRDRGMGNRKDKENKEPSKGKVGRPAVGANETKDDRIGRVADADSFYDRPETWAVVGMNPREELRGGESPFGAEAQDLRSVLAALRQAAARIPLERCHRPGGQRFLQPCHALLDHGLVVTPLGEQRRKNVCA
jgi:hypothetical protein